MSTVAAESEPTVDAVVQTYQNRRTSEVSMASSSPYATFHADAWMRESMIRPRNAGGGCCASPASLFRSQARIAPLRCSCSGRIVSFPGDRFLLTLDDGHLVQKRDCFAET